MDSTPAIELGAQTWRKQILPVGWLNYDDGVTKRRLNFTSDYLKNLVSAFKAKAFDAVPLQVGAAHNNDPENTAGQIIGLDSDDRGLYATVSTTDRGTQLLKDHQNLGVSVRIVEDYEHQNGKASTPYKAALQHVLATWVPRVAGMAPWQAVQCSDESEGRFIDLSALVFTDDGTAVAPAPAGPGGQQVPPTQKARAPVPEQLTEEELAGVRSILPLLQKIVAPADSADDETTDTEDEAKPPRKIKAPVAPVVEAEGEDDAEDDAEQDIAASDDDTDGIELTTDANALELARVTVEMAQMRAERDNERWERESRELVVDMGLPPALIKVAAPLLKGRGHTVELSQGSTVDAGKVVRDLLHAVAKTYPPAVDLSGPIGSPHEVAASEAEDAQMNDVITRANAARFAR
jgi:hypothetical protein